MIQITRVLIFDLYDLWTTKATEKGNVQTNLPPLSDQQENESHDTTK